MYENFENLTHTQKDGIIKNAILTSIIESDDYLPLTARQANYHIDELKFLSEALLHSAHYEYSSQDDISKHITILENYAALVKFKILNQGLQFSTMDTESDFLEEKK